MEPNEVKEFFRCYTGEPDPDGFAPHLILAIIEMPKFSRTERFLSVGGQEFSREARHTPWGIVPERGLQQKRLSIDDIFTLMVRVSSAIFRTYIRERYSDPATILAYRDFEFRKIEEPLPFYQWRQLTKELPDFRVVTTTNSTELTALAETVRKTKSLYSEPADDDWTPPSA